jgi:hypothetical protein
VDGLILSWTVCLGQEKEGRRDGAVVVSCSVPCIGCGSWMLSRMVSTFTLPYKLESEV